MAEQDAEVFIPDETAEQNVAEGEVHEPDPDLPDEDDPEFQSEVEAGHDEGEVDDA